MENDQRFVLYADKIAWISGLLGTIRVKCLFSQNRMGKSIGWRNFQYEFFLLHPHVFLDVQPVHIKFFNFFSSRLRQEIALNLYFKHEIISLPGSVTTELQVFNIN